MFANFDACDAPDEIAEGMGRDPGENVEKQEFEIKEVA